MTPEFIRNIYDSLKYKSYSSLVEDLYVSSLLDSFQRIKGIPGLNSKTENEIRNYLVFDLENYNKLLSPYLQQKILKLTKENTILLTPEETKRTDIEFFMSGYGDFVAECKNLRSVDQRYIDDGVNRFINELYSKKDSDSAMLGFVISGNISSIIAGLKTRVEKVDSFSKEDNHPDEKCKEYDFSFHSTHKRNSGNPILIHHLFVDLNSMTVLPKSTSTI